MKSLKNILFFAILTSILVFSSSLRAQQGCFDINLSNDPLNFSKSSGTQTTTIQSNCTGNFTVSNPGSNEDWVSITVVGKTITVTVDANTGDDRFVGVNIRYNNSTTNAGFTVNQEGIPPPPPAQCVVSGFDDSAYLSSGETKNFTLLYSNCASEVFFNFTDEHQNPLPEWVTVTQFSTTGLTVEFDANNGTSTRSVIITGKRPDGGPGGIGGTFEQPCNPKTWYADSDGDGFRDPNSTAIEDCADRGTGWTMNPAVDRCPTEPSTANVLRTWYVDSDGDGFRDPGNSSIQRCNEPSGNWTLNTAIDNCPDQPYSSNGGCDPNCDTISLSNAQINFSEAAGSATSTISFPSGCTSPYAITLGSTPSWLTATFNPSNNRILVEVFDNSNGEDEEDTIEIFVNGVPSRPRLFVTQDGPPPPPPAQCAVSGFDDSAYLSSGETKNFTLLYSNCASEGYFNFTDEHGNSLPDWVKILQTSSTELTMELEANNGNALRLIRVIGSRTDEQPGGIGGTFEQPCNPKTWYADSDGDGFRDPNSTPIEDCADRGTGWTMNPAVDNCPDIYRPLNDCESDGIITGNNYIYKRDYQVQSDEVIDPEFFTENDQLIQNITYFDGLGRGLQQVAIAQSPNKNDIVTHMEYDVIGRMEKEWLPYPTTDGALATLRSGTITAIEDYYNTPKFENTENPYSQKAFEASPLNRVMKQAAPGNDWAMGEDHEIGLEYQTNGSNDNVKLFEVTTTTSTTNGVITYDAALEANGTYAEGELYKNITYDENNTGGKNHSTEEFTNKSGQVVLKRTYADLSSLGGDAEEAHDTYYVYDNFGNLTYVLPPKMNTTTSSITELNNAMADLAYQYTYDHRNRLVVKKIPGKGEEYIVYNRLDQPIMTQDANLRAKNEWLFTKYDAFGRVAYTGKVSYTQNREREEIQDTVNNLTGNLWVTQGNYTNGGINIGYTNAAFPTSGTIAVLTVNYYDNYDNKPTGAPNTVTLLGSEPTESNATNVQGLATVSRVRVLDVSPAKWIHTLTYYDDKARPIYAYSENGYLGTVDIVETQLDFVGRPLKVKSSHTRNGETITTLDNFTYDHVGRLLTQTQCIGDETLGDSCPTSGGSTSAIANLELEDQTVTSDQIATNSITILPTTTISGTVTLEVDPNATISGDDEELIVSNTYDEIGQLISKQVGGAADAEGLQTVNYEYNVRGWLEGINDTAINSNNLSVNTDDLWGFQILYNASSNPLFNGNISQTNWDSKSENMANVASTQYSYTYDPLNRITAATGGQNSNYNVSNITYDKMGNIQSLTRNGYQNNSTFTNMDVLDYDYDSGNKLTKVTDGGNDAHGFKDGTNTNDDFEYDINGNMISDANKGITAITYNHLNLPTKITVVNGSDNGTIEYKYDATGAKLKKIVSGSSNGTTDYAGNYIYENDKLQFFNHAEGTVSPKNINDYTAGFDYTYNYKDHLGNIRLSYTDANGDGDITTNEIIKESNYYPFGLEHKGYNNNVSSLGNSAAKKYMFGGKESQDELGLGWYDITARNYDPALGRWMNLDPLAEQMRRHSTYNYAFDNPVYFVDPDGMMPVGGIGDFFRKKVAQAKSVINTGKALLQTASKILDVASRTSVTLAGETKLTSGFQVSAQINDNVGFEVNLINVELAGAKIEGTASSEGLESTSDIGFFGDDSNNVSTESELSIGIGIPGIAAVGAAAKHSETKNMEEFDSKTIASETSGSFGVTTGPVSAGATRGVDNVSGTGFTSVNTQLGGKIALLLGIEASLNIEIKIDDKDE